MAYTEFSTNRRRRRRGPRLDLRVYVLGILMLAALGGVVAKLWYLQVARGEAYRAKIAGRSYETVRLPSVRGEIRDRNGIPLVQNRASYEVDFYLRDMVRGFKEQHDGEEPLIEYQGTERGMPKMETEADIVQIVNSAVVPRLEDLDLAKDYNARKLKMQFRNQREIPFTYMEDIDFPTIAKFSEHDVGLPGVDISIKPVREYLYGALAAHLLGYVGMPVNVDLDEAKKYTFYQPDVEGKSQVEAAMDKYLRGAPGVRMIQRNVKGTMEGDVKTIPPTPGDNVYLTIDARIQMLAETALRQPLLGRAAVVVVDPNNGDILAMASIPSFDPNIFIPSVSGSNWKALNKNPAVPLVDRAVSGFPPGSTFKVVTALAGLRKGMVNDKFDCPGSIDYGGRPFHCWIAEKGGSHGILGLADAIKVSCDCFFYQYGNKAGIDSIDNIGSLLGFGQKYDIGLSDEQPGVMPGPEWMREKYPKEKWSTAYTANVSIGQGYVLASPLQLAMAYSTVANGGICYTPRLIKTVLTPDGQPARDDDGNIAVPDQPKVRGDLRTEVRPQDIEVVRHGFWEVVNEEGGPGGGGTGAKGRIPGVVVAGKTGTAQSSERGKKENIAWFCCFAPYDHPKYVVVAMVQGGHHGGSVAGPVANYVLSHALAMDQGKYQVQLASLRPADNPNPFNVIEALPDYKDTAPGLTPEASTGGGDEESAPDEQNAQSPEMGIGGAKPDIQAQPDEQGRVSGQHNAPSAAPTPDRRSLFDRIFHPSHGSAPASGSSTHHPH